MQVKGHSWCNVVSESSISTSIKMIFGLFPFYPTHTGWVYLSLWVIPPESDTCHSQPQITRILKLLICFSEQHADMKDEQIQIWSRGTHKSSNRVRYYDPLFPLIQQQQKSGETFREVTYSLFCSCSDLEFSLCFELETHDYFFFHCKLRYCSYSYFYFGRLVQKFWDNEIHVKSHGSHTILEELNCLINAKSAILISFTERGVTNAVSL